MALSALTAEGLRSQRMDGETEEQPLEDEFACPGVLRGALGSLRPTVQQVFGVTLSIEGEDAFLQDGQMWLRLRGAGRDVQAAKVNRHFRFLLENQLHGTINTTMEISVVLFSDVSPRTAEQKQNG